MLDPSGSHPYEKPDPDQKADQDQADQEIGPRRQERQRHAGNSDGDQDAGENEDGAARQGRQAPEEADALLRMLDVEVRRERGRLTTSPSLLNGSSSLGVGHRSSQSDYTMCLLSCDV